MHSLTSILDGCEWSASHPSHFTPRKGAPGTHWIDGTQYQSEKFPTPAGIQAPIVRPVVTVY